ncbi:MAG: hypothetical protein H6Q35_2255 [Proteobacteria bacterium]|nr:hypothetical protein [Pseudomonadota bacterium]
MQESRTTLTLQSIIVDLVQRGIKKGRDLDAAVLSMVGNTFNQYQGDSFVLVELNDEQILKFFIDDSDQSFWYPRAGVFHFCAYYQHTNNFPLGRCYFIKIGDLISAGRLLKKFFEGLPTPYHESDIEKLTDPGSLPQRIKQYQDTCHNQESLVLKNLFNGRVIETATTKCIYLKTSGCLVCGSIASHYVATTVSDTQDGLMVAFFTCKEHFNEVKSYNSNFDWLCEKLHINVPDIFQSTDMTRDELLAISKEILESDLECEDIAMTSDTITCFRKSRLKIILRMTAPLKYAYMFYDVQGNQLARFDGANHHNDKLEFPPDHFHVAPEIDNNNIRQSFLTGYFPLDIKGINNVINELERHMSNSY